MCQCPLSGFLHFYGIIMGKYTLTIWCQCPLSGFLHFYGSSCIWTIWRRRCVNALYRAFSISTLPSGNALKWSICRLDFAGNCLTISKSAYFLLFLCLFTLCSYFLSYIDYSYKNGFISFIVTYHIINVYKTFNFQFFQLSHLANICRYLMFLAN